MHTVDLFKNIVSLSLFLSLSINSGRLQLPLFSKARQSCCSLISLPSGLPSSTLWQQFLNCTGNEVSPPDILFTQHFSSRRERERGPAHRGDRGARNRPALFLSLSWSCSFSPGISVLFQCCIAAGRGSKGGSLMAKALQISTWTHNAWQAPRRVFWSCLLQHEACR